MTDYKSMYFHLAGRMANTIDVLETTTQILDTTSKSLEATAKALEATTQSLGATSRSLTELKEKLKLAQQVTEEMFINGDDDLDEKPE